MNSDFSEKIIHEMNERTNAIQRYKMDNISARLKQLFAACASLSICLVIRLVWSLILGSKKCALSLSMAHKKQTFSKCSIPNLTNLKFCISHNST